MKKTLPILCIQSVFTIAYWLLGNPASAQTQPKEVPQDVVYLFLGDQVQEALDTRIEGLTADKIMLRSGKGNVKSLSWTSVLMAFSRQGNFLVISELSTTDLDSAKRQLKAFTDAPLRSDGNDYLIVAKPLSVSAARIVVDNANVLNYKTIEGNSASINKNELLAILYRDGRHKLLKSPIEVAPYLAEIRPDIKNGGKPIAKATPLPPPVDTTSVVAEKVLENKEGQMVLTNEEKEKYQESSLHRLDDFIVAINTITDKNRSEDEKDRAINDALRLFTKEATIQVNSVKNKNPRTLSIKNYLTQLRLLPYKRTTVDWVKVHFIENLTQTGDGSYEGIITGEQLFTAEGTGGKIVYSDATKKDVRVKLDQRPKIVNGKTSMKWHILLGNISVKSEE